jgi:RNA polymerase sigma factor (sigma-70 family)
MSRAGRGAPGLRLRLRSDDRLARDAAGGDAEAFAALYERHHQPLYRYCRSIVADPDDAADALQATMTRAWAAIGDRDPAAPVRAWLFRIAHNESISLVRRRRPAEELDANALVSPDAATDAEQRRRLAELLEDLHGLSERQRGALLMREVSGLGHAEIAAVFGVAEGAVKQTIYEARVALQDLAAGREMSCASVRRMLSDGDGRTARGRRMRAHLRSCEGCRAFREALRVRRSELRLIAPALPAGAAAAVLEAVIGGSAAGGGGLLAGLLGGGATKAVAVGAATVTVGAGAVTLTSVRPFPEGREPVAEAVERERGPGGRRARDAAAPAAQVAVPVVHDTSPSPDRGSSVPGSGAPGGGDRGSSGPDRGSSGPDRGSSGPDRGRSDDDRGSSGDRRGSSPEGEDGGRSGSGPSHDDDGGDDSSGRDSAGSDDDDDPSGSGSSDDDDEPESSGNGGSSGPGSGEPVAREAETEEESDED